MPVRDIIVAGASAGGVEALGEFVSVLSADLPAAVLVVLHIPATHTSVLPAILNRKGPLPAALAVDGEAIRPGHIYVAPPDHHLLVRRGYVSVTRGPQENGHRPAIDPLFRTASQAYGPRVVGIIMSGVQDDGVAGLRSIGGRGGVMIAQAPETALYPTLPRNAIQSGEGVLVLPLAAMGHELERRAHERVADMHELPNELAHGLPGDDHGRAGQGHHRDEAPFPDQLPSAEVVETTGAEVQGTPTGYTCPLCHGALWESAASDVLHFRCRVGHAYSSVSLLGAQSEALDTALWEAVRALEEIAALRGRLARRFSDRGSVTTAQRFADLARASARSAHTVRTILVDGRVTGIEETAMPEAEAE